MSSERKFCSNCGTPLAEGASFCINCGKRIEKPTEPAAAIPKAEAPAQAPVQETAYMAYTAPTQETAYESYTEPAQENTYEEPEYSYNEPVEETYVAEKPEKVNKGIGIGTIILVAGITAVVSIVVTLLLVLLLGLGTKETIKYVNNNDNNSSSDDVNVDGNKVSTGDNITINIDGDSDGIASAVYAKCEKSVVGIRIMYETKSVPWQRSSLETYGEGSGVIFSADGKIITNCHVVADALDSNGNVRNGYYIRVYLDKELTTYYEATVLGVDESTDLALIKIEQTGLTPIEFADGDSIGIGQKVFSLGSPGGLEFMNSICEGIVSGLNRNLTTDSGYVYDLIQTTAAINPGNSGGALLNSEGKLVGICSMKIASSSYDDMCFAISVKTVDSIISSIAENGKVVRPVLGISVRPDYTAEIAAASGYPAGVWVYSVEEDSMAYNAGLRSGMIITEIEGEAITSFGELKSMLNKYSIGETVSVRVFDSSSEEYKSLNVTLQSSN